MPIHPRGIVVACLLSASTCALAAAADAPSWLPAEGEVATLTAANGRLTNSFVSCVAPYYEPFYSVKICNDYSTGWLDPYFGDYGALIFFGGGHAATNDNTVMALVLGKDSCSFRRMTD